MLRSSVLMHYMRTAVGEKVGANASYVTYAEVGGRRWMLSC
jgi:hypothetical protein